MKKILLSILVAIFLLNGATPVYSQAKADRAVRFFENLKHTKGKFTGKPFTLLDWEEKIIRDVYGTLKEDGTRQYKTIYIEIPKKNGKTELAAGAALFHLFADGERNGEIYGCAADREQASLVYDASIIMIDQAPTLGKRSRITESTKKVKDKVSGSVYKVESAEAYTKHGLNISACIIDELHAQPNRNLYDVMTHGSGDAREQPIWWIITTAGDDPDRVSIGWEVHEYALKVLSGEIIDPTWYVVIYGYDGDDIYNEANWYKANPSLGHTIKIDSMREAAIKAKNNPADERLFRWLRLNQWITTKLTTWLPLSLFEEAVGTWERQELVGLDCYLGMDLSSTTDLTSICLIFPPQGTQADWRAIWYCWIPEENMRERIHKDKVPYDQWAEQGWVIPTPGNAVDYTRVRDTILQLKEIYNIKEVDSDPAFAAMLLQELQNEDMTCVAVPQTFMGLTDAMNQVEIFLKGKLPEGEKTSLLEGKLTVENNPLAKWAFGNTSIAQNGSGLKKYVKEYKGKHVVRTKRIDPIAAMVCAMARARFYKGKVDLSAKILSEDWGM